MHSLFQQFLEANTEQEFTAIQKQLAEGGFSLFQQFIHQFQEAIKQYEDGEQDYIQAQLEKAKQLFPEPGLISPSWQTIWQEYETMITYKNNVLQQINLAERDGEWQIILNNPFTNQQVVCYPALQFLEAAYLYGYFAASLEKNEYLRMQKIQTLIVTQGSEIN